MPEELVCVPLKEYLLHLRQEDNEKIDLRFDNMDKALILAKEVNDVRFEQLNHIRLERDRDREEFLKKETYDSKTSGYDTWCSSVNDRLTKIEQRSVTWTAAVGLIFLIVTIILQWVRK